MESINHFTRLTAAFLGLTILVLGIAAIWLIRMRKKSLKTKKAETEERGLFSQTDELVPIDEIGPGVIVTNGGKKFVVVLKCGGSDFYTKPIGEKVIMLPLFQNLRPGLHTAYMGKTLTWMALSGNMRRS